MTANEEQYLLQASSIEIAHDLVELAGVVVAERSARYMVRSYAFGNNSPDGMLIAFWSNVLTRVCAMNRDHSYISPERRAALMSVIERARPQTSFPALTGEGCG